MVGCTIQHTIKVLGPSSGILSVREDGWELLHSQSTCLGSSSELLH